jgi:glycosyltransferase involved in cell wall biosynthesis
MWQVVHVITRLELGGAQLATLDEASNSRFPTAGRTLLYGPGGLLDAEARRLEHVRTYEIPAMDREVSGLGDLRALVQIWRRLRQVKKENPRTALVVHTHCPKAGVLGRWAAFFAGADLIVHSAHGWGYQGSKMAQFVFRWIHRVTGLVTDGLTGDSSATIREWTSDHLAGRALTRVVYCGVEIDRFRRADRDPAAVRRELEIPDSHRVVLNMSCLKPQKDPLAYVRVAARVVESFPEVTFLLAGDGYLREEVERLAQELNLGSRFRLLGWRRDVVDLVHVSDLLVLTSRWEGLPQAIVQAMAAGRAVVATAVNGVPEAVDDGATGLLYRPGDVRGIGEGILVLLNDDERRRAMGEVGRSRVATFSRERMLEDLDCFYEELASRCRYAAPAA